MECEPFNSIKGTIVVYIFDWPIHRLTEAITLAHFTHVHAIEEGKECRTCENLNLNFPHAGCHIRWATGPYVYDNNYVHM